MREFNGRDIPAYAILSHTWVDDQEITYQEYIAGDSKYKAGYKKIHIACLLAKADRLPYVWVDTCCIDKKSSAELSEAINSMHRWYERSAVCYAFLQDLEPGADMDTALGDCRW